MTPIDYNDPNDPWRTPGYDPYKGMSDKQKFLASLGQVVSIVIGMVMAMILCALFFSSCTTTKYVPIQQQHTEHHWHTDSVKERDSTHTENTTIIRELDSAAMAKYGIQMQNNQRAWLVLQREMEQRLRELERMTAQRDTVRDSIPVPYPVKKEVPAELTGWQQTRMHLGDMLLVAALLALLVWVVRWKTRI